MRLAQVQTWCALSVLLALFVFCGCGRKSATQPDSEPGKGNEPPNPRSGTPTPPKGPDPGAIEPLLLVKADLTLSSQEFHDQFLNNAKDFVAKHQHQVLDIVGTVTSYDYLPDGDRGNLTLNPGALRISCWDPHPMAKAMPGQKIALRGKWIPGRGYEKLVIASVEGEGPPTIKAEELVNAWKVNPATAEPNSVRFLIVTGTLHSIRTEQKLAGPEYSLAFTETGTAFNFVFGQYAKEVAERHGWLKQGQPVRVMGYGRAPIPTLAGCVVLPPTK